MSSADGDDSLASKSTETTPLIGNVVEDAYSNVPLNPKGKQIRVLHLHGGSYSSSLCGTLAVVDLKDQPRYEALSYTWGASTLSNTIMINGRHHLPLTDNFWRALRGLRYKWRERILWIDALCINQNDIGERGQQVTFMGDIYHTAHQVCVWFGEPAPTTLLERVMSSMTSMIGLPRVFAGRTDSYPGWPEGFAEKLGSAWLSLYRNPLASALSNSHPEWSSRVWTVQEFCLAKQITWCFGRHEIACDVTAYSGNLSRARDDDVDPDGILGELASALYAYDDVLRDINQIRSSTQIRQLRATDVKNLYRDADSNLHLYKSLAPLIEWSRRKKATDPRDKVFSLRAFLAPQAAEHFPPDYDKPCALVFAEASFSLFADPEHSDVGTAFGLAHTSTPSSIAGLPSWAIDFTYLIQSAFGPASTQRGDPELADFHIRKDPLPLFNPRIVGSGKAPRLRATVTFFDKVRVSMPGWGLDATGKIVEQEQDAQTQRFKPKNYDEAGVMMLDMLRTVAKSAGRKGAPETVYGQTLRRPSPREKPEEAYSMAADGAAQDALRTSPFGFSRMDVLPKLFRWWSEYVGLLAAPLETGAAMTGSPEQQYWKHVDEGYSRFVPYANLSDQGHCMFATVGGFLGAAPDMSEAGDVVALVRGCNLPLILRQQEDSSFLFRGLGYVHGIMQDELHRFWEDNEVFATEITLA
ncbi:hypothetical protein LTR53_007580 [Teratosphaeriaceae sp. CCFEE 6253]|nr:hypothetical protein LTR53_007580 [Teratosphaeriaceae sp. CCFEE 6253]